MSSDEQSTVELFTVGEVASKFRVRERTVYRWLKSGRMAGIRTPGGQHRIPGEEVMREFAALGEPFQEN